MSLIRGAVTLQVEGPSWNGCSVWATADTLYIGYSLLLKEAQFLPFKLEANSIILDEIVQSMHFCLEK